MRKLRSGKLWIGYYYNQTIEGGKQKEIPLGTDLNEAKAGWARMERKAVEKPIRLMGDIFDRYEREIIPGKKPRTQQDNRNELKNLRKAFESAPIDAITPHVVAQYRDARTAKTRGNREIALLSHVFNIAREWGFTERENPCTRVRRNKEKPRDYYATEDVWEAVYAMAVQELKDAMDLAYLTGQRPSNTLKAVVNDITEDFLLVGQGKTGKKLRIKLTDENGPTGLGVFLEQLMERRALTGIRGPQLITNARGLRMSYPMLRNRWDEARGDATKKAVEAGDLDLAARIKDFQFRDIRPKAASEIDDLTHASRLLGHSKEQITKTIYRRIGEIVDPTK